MDEPSGPMYAAIAAGTAITYVILAVTRTWGGVWIIPIPVAAAATLMVALADRRRPR
jgi:hypothetical protein